MTVMSGGCDRHDDIYEECLVCALEAAELRLASEKEERDFFEQRVTGLEEDLAHALEERDGTGDAAYELAHLVRRMLQSLDAYWLGYEGLPKNRHPRGKYTAEDWWGRFERYRKEVEAMSGVREAG